MRVYGESVLASEPPMEQSSVGFSQAERQPCFQMNFWISLQELAVSFMFFQYVFWVFPNLTKDFHNVLSKILRACEKSNLCLIIFYPNIAARGRVNKIKPKENHKNTKFACINIFQVQKKPHSPTKRKCTVKLFSHARKILRKISIMS